ncbi:MAG: carboxypeptidase-like regulatory domain-containing protein [Planctomycetota bacterium]|nr:carboxypeptidase-like regulatory domain-containing protein [Planctomycetota bacterium]
MKPLLVLVLVIVAAGALFFALNIMGDDGTTTAGGLGPEAVAPADGGSQPTPGELRGPDAGTGRDVAAIADDVDAPNTRAVLNDGFDNALVGTVQNESGGPVADASVTLGKTNLSTMVFVNDPVDHSGERHTKTDAKGAFAFEGVEPFDSYALTVKHAEYSKAEVEGIRVGADGRFEQPPIVMAGGVALRGYVRDVTGGAVPDATLHLDGMLYAMNAITEHDHTVTSDASGYYEFTNLNPGNKALSITADGFGNAFINGLSFDSGKPSFERDITLEVAEMICGKVFDITQTPIEGASVVAIAYSNSTQQCRDATVTDAKGEFCLRALNAGKYTIAVKKPGFKAVNNERADTGSINVVIEMSPQASVSGTVIALSSGEPLSSFTCVLRQTYENHPATSQTKVKRDFRSQNGSYRLTDVPPGSYVVEARARGFASSYSDPFRVDQGSVVTGVMVRMTQGGSISGVIVDGAGKPVARARVTTHDNTWTDSEFDRMMGDMMPTNASKAQTNTGADGSFTLSNLMPEAYQIRVKSGAHCEFIQQEILVSEGGDTGVGTIELISGGTISGVVLDATGQTVAGSRVDLRVNGRTNGIPRFYQTRSNAKGKYVLANVSPGSYRLNATPPRTAGGGGDFLLDMGDLQQLQKTITVADGKQLTIELKIGGN